MEHGTQPNFIFLRYKIWGFVKIFRAQVRDSVHIKVLVSQKGILGLPSSIRLSELSWYIVGLRPSE